MKFGTLNKSSEGCIETWIDLFLMVGLDYYNSASLDFGESLFAPCCSLLLLAPAVLSVDFKRASSFVRNSSIRLSEVGTVRGDDCILWK